MSTSTDDFLMGGAATSAKFEHVGDTVTGTIVTTEVRQQTDIQTGQPLVWDNGDPRMQLVVALQTDQRDDPDDDGIRMVYIKGSKARGSKSLHDAVRAAVEQAKTKGLEAGGTLTVSFIGEEPSKTKGFNPRKLWQATYTPPDTAAAASDFLGMTPEPVAKTPPPATTPASASASASGSPADTARQLIGLGLDDTQIAAAVGLDISVITAIRAAS